MILLRYIVSACVLLSCTTLLPSQVPFDLSKAKEFKTVWSMQLGGGSFPISHVTNVGGVSELNVLVGNIIGRGRFTWRTCPKLDTTSIDNTLGINPREIDYDGVPPMEYLNNSGHILQCSNIGDSPFPLTPIDTVGGCSYYPEQSVDLDGDGYLDVITDVGGDGKAARVVMGGPMAGKGCERVFAIPAFHGKDIKYADVYSFYRSAIGGWVLIQWERCSNCNDPAMRIYDVTFERKEGKLSPIYTLRHEFYGSGANTNDDPFGPGVIVVDTILKRDFFVLQRRLGGAGKPWAVERYDVTERQFKTTGEQVTGYPIDNDSDLMFGHRLAYDRAVLGISSDRGLLFCFSDNITAPFARWIPTNTGTQPVAGITVINDQTGDGQPDIVVVGGSSSNATMILISLDSNIVSVSDNPTQQSTTTTVALENGTLEITLKAPSQISASISSVSGKRIEAMPPRMGQPGVNRYPLENVLGTLSPGAYFLVVQMGSEQVTIPFFQ